MGIKTRILFNILILVTLCGCETYKTFYKPTHTIADTHFATTQRLNLSNAHQDSIARLLPLHKNLKFLNLSGIAAPALGTILQNVSNPERLKVLILDSIGLETLPQEIQRFSNLKQLSLNNNPKLNFNAAFGIVKHLPLVFLNLQNNELRIVPESIQELTTLVDVNLTGNKLHADNSLQPLKMLPKIKSLWLTDNNLSVLPKSLYEITTLKGLYIEYNRLTELPEALLNLKKLWILHAGHNNFEMLPEVLSKMDILLLVHINNCAIAHIPDSFDSKTSKLAGIILDENKLPETTKARWRKAWSRFFILSI
jgi:Leucine-rich repeat (LRR) protein